MEYTLHPSDTYVTYYEIVHGGWARPSRRTSDAQEPTTEIVPLTVDPGVRYLLVTRYSPGAAAHRGRRSGTESRSRAVDPDALSPSLIDAMMGRWNPWGWANGEISRQEVERMRADVR